MMYGFIYFGVCFYGILMIWKESNIIIGFFNSSKIIYRRVFIYFTIQPINENVEIYA